MASLAPFPTVRANAFHRYMGSGYTKSPLFQCETEEGQQDDYVIKFRTARHGSATGCLFETLGYQLANHFSLPTPPAALVRFDADLLSALGHDEALRARIEQDAGCAFGSRLMTGYSTMPRVAFLPASLRDLAVDIIAFDAMTANFDRLSSNPNLLWNEDGLLLIDHEQAFRFLYDSLWLGGATWNQRLFFLADHALSLPLRRPAGPVSFDRFRSALSTLTGERLSEICDSIPSEFGAEPLPEICRQLSRTRDEVDAFIQAVWRRIR